MSQPYVYRNPRVMRHAAGQACQNCGANDASVAAAHSTLQEHGRGNFHRAHDLFVAFLCGECAGFLDACGARRDPTGLWSSSHADKREMFLRAMFRTQVILLRDGVLKWI